MRGQRETRPCAGCGKSITRLLSQTRGREWYCDRRCQIAHAPPRLAGGQSIKIERICACGRAFTTFPSINSEHCSRACSSRFKPRKPRRGETTPCRVCGTAVYADRGQRAKGQGLYCSRACAIVAQTKDPVVKACPRCGTEMRLKPSQAGRVYCSRACQTAARMTSATERTHNGRPVRQDAKGYILLWEPDHPNTSQKGWQFEHRLVAERVLGRHLTRDEAVHHLNGVKDQNDPANLSVMDGKEHAALSANDYRDSINRQLAELAEYRRLYGPLPGKE